MTHLDPARIPPELHALIPLAEKYGIADDCQRERRVKSSTSTEIQLLKEVVIANDDALDSWLAGDEANGPTYTNEYIAFSAMRMAADYA